MAVDRASFQWCRHLPGEERYDNHAARNRRNSESVSMVVLNGRLYDAKTLNEIGTRPRTRKPFWSEKN